MENKREIRKKRSLSLVDFSFWLGNWWEWVSVLLVFLTLEIAVLSIEQAKWINPHPSLTLTLVLSVLTGLFLVKRRLPGVLKWLLAIVIGAGVTIWQALTLLPPSATSSRIDQLVIALKSFWQTLSIAQPTGGTIHFAILLTFIIWVLGYVSTWFILRRQNAWVVVTLGIIAILINLSNLPDTYYGFFFFYLVAAILLIGQTRLVKYHYQPAKDGSNYPNRGLAYFMAAVFCLGLLATSIAWFTPQIRASRLEAVISTKIPGRNNIEEYFTNFFADVPRKQSYLKADERKEFSFRDICERNEDDVHFVISSDSAHYWRVRTYNVYTSSGWKTSGTTERRLGQEDISEIVAGQNEITYTVETHIKTDIVLTAGEIISSDIPASVYVLSPLSFDETREQTGTGYTVAVVTPYLLKPRQRFTVVTSTIYATPAELAEAGDDYPSWVTDYFLQLPSSLPERVRRLAEDITEESPTPYEKVLAIGDYISRFSYDLYTELPPEEVDGVDNFIFTQQSGRCSDFASAMVVMLRAAGVPARFCIGYLPGEWDRDTKSYIIRANHFHAWAEVYFPDYGWIETEATSGVSSSSGVVGVQPSGEYSVQEQQEIYNIPAGGSSTDTTRVNTTLPIWLWSILLLGIGAIILALILLYTLRSSVSRRVWYLEGADYASEVYARMCNLAALVKLGPKPHQTPLEYCTELALELPQQARAINNIVQSYQECRFGGKKEPEFVVKGELLKSRRDVFNALLERMPRRRW